MLFFKFVIVASIFIVAVSSINAGCDKRSLTNCSKNYSTILSPNVNLTSITQDPEYFCKGFRAMERCIRDFISTCDDQQEIMMIMNIYEGFISFYGEICTEGEKQDTFLRHATCMKTGMEEVNQCSNKSMNALNRVNRIPQRAEHLRRETCCLIQDLIKCVKDTSKRICGKETGNYFGWMMKTLLSVPIETACGNWVCASAVKMFVSKFVFLVLVCANVIKITHNLLALV